VNDFISTTRGAFIVCAQYFLILMCAVSLAAENPALQKSNTPENLRGVSALAHGIAWASGTHGTYLRTTDLRSSGGTWQAAQVPGAEALDFRDVKAFSADLAYLLSAGPGEQSRIYKTTDAGKTWKLQFTNKNPKGFFDCMAFWDRDHGIAVGDPIADNFGKLKFELISTEDGGKNWKAIPPDALPPAIEGEGAFAASGTCIAIQGKKNAWFATGGKVARVFRSTTGGKTWTVAETPLIHGPASAGIFSVAFRDAKHGVIAGGDYQHPEQSGPNLAFTSDSGRTWKLSTASPQAYFSAVAFDRTNDRILALGTALAVELRKDRAKKIADLSLNSLSISSTGQAIAVGPKGVIVNFPSIP
jgi:photosystem II stability/assembly factor-like uncharacterized protein